MKKLLSVYLAICMALSLCAFAIWRRNGIQSLQLLRKR